MKPNIFKIATTELSQDSFFAWLLQWADSSQNIENSALNETAINFVRFLIGESQNYLVNKVIAGRQWNKIDVWAQINDEYFICIEDKTNSSEHSEQLVRYKDLVTTHFGKSHKLIFIYLKTGNENLTTLNKINAKGYSVINRKDVLRILNERESSSEILNDFKDNLTRIEKDTNSFVDFSKIHSVRLAAEGFYIKLQELLDGETHWQYVSNRSGGFLCFCYYWKSSGWCTLYIQIENTVMNNIKLVLKISERTDMSKSLYEFLSELDPYAKKYLLDLRKPSSFGSRAKATLTLGIVHDAFVTDIDGVFNFDKFLTTLKKIENMIDNYTSDKWAEFNFKKIEGNFKEEVAEGADLTQILPSLEI